MTLSHSPLPIPPACPFGTQCPIQKVVSVRAYSADVCYVCVCGHQPPKSKLNRNTMLFNVVSGGFLYEVTILPPLLLHIVHHEPECGRERQRDRVVACTSLVLPSIPSHHVPLIWATGCWTVPACVTCNHTDEVEDGPLSIPHAG